MKNQRYIINEPDPERAGADAEKLRGVYELISEGCTRGLYPGAALWVSRAGVTAGLYCVGHTDFSRTETIDEDTLFDLASLTKPIATAPAVLTLVKDGLIDLKQPISDFFPARDLSHIQDVTVFDLLTHTSGLPAWRDLYRDGITREQAAYNLFSVQPTCKPGEEYEYSCLGYIILSLIVEQVSGLPFDVFVKTRVFDPLGLSVTTFQPDPARKIASTGFCPRRDRELRGEVHDLNAFAFNAISGNAGLFSTVRDLATFCHTVTTSSQDRPFLPEALSTTDTYFTNAIHKKVGGQTLSGWYIWPNPMLPVSDSVTKSVIGHTGFTGTAIIMEHKQSLCSVFLTNRVCSAEPASEFRTLRKQVFDALHCAFLW